MVRDRFLSKSSHAPCALGKRLRWRASLLTAVLESPGPAVKVTATGGVSSKTDARELALVARLVVPARPNTPATASASVVILCDRLIDGLLLRRESPPSTLDALSLRSAALAAAAAPRLTQPGLPRRGRRCPDPLAP